MANDGRSHQAATLGVGVQSVVEILVALGLYFGGDARFVVHVYGGASQLLAGPLYGFDKQRQSRGAGELVVWG